MKFTPEVQQHLRGEPKKPTGAQATEIFNSINTVLEGAGCPLFEIFDDESFYEDGVDLP